MTSKKKLIKFHAEWVFRLEIFEFNFQKFLIGLLSRQGPSHKLWLTSKFFKSLNLLKKLSRTWIQD